MAYAEPGKNYGGSVVGYGIGYVAARILGINPWVPLLVAAFATFVIGRFRPQVSPTFRWAIALTVGQAGWMALGAAVLPSLLSQVLPDLVFDVALVAWCLARPSRASAISLIVFELVTLGANIFIATKLGQWGPQMAALVTHMGLRTAIIALAVIAIRKGVSLATMEHDVEVFS